MTYRESRDLYFKNNLRKERAKISLEVIAKENPKICLDIGCGLGFYTFDISKKAGLAIGGDVADNACLWEQYKKETKIKNINFLRFDAKRLPFKDCSFDIVHVSQVLEHIPDVSVAIREMRRVSKGSVIADVPTFLWEARYYLFEMWWWGLTHPKRVISKFIKKIRTKSAKTAIKQMCIGDHVNKYGTEKWLDLFRKNGFEVKEYKKICGGMTLFIHAIKTDEQ